MIEALLAATLLVSQCESYTITSYSIAQFPGTTASGISTQGQAGVIAAGSYNLPFGTLVNIEGVGTYRIEDRGRLGARHIDILLQTTREALNFGRQTRVVCIVE